VSWPSARIRPETFVFAFIAAVAVYVLYYNERSSRIRRTRSGQVLALAHERRPALVR
jgi:hypothetical protein